MMFFNSIALSLGTECIAYAEEIYEQHNLRAIIGYWHQILPERADANVIDPSAVAVVARATFSPYANQNRAKVRIWCLGIRRKFGVWAVGHIFLLSAMFLLYLKVPGVVRMLSGCALMSLVLGVMAFCVIEARSFGGRDADRAYLSDYVYVNGVNFSAPDQARDGIIVAFARNHGVRGKTRTVGFLNGVVRNLTDEELRKAAIPQGLEGAVDMFLGECAVRRLDE